VGPEPAAFLDIQSGDSVVLPVVIPQVDGVRSTGLQKTLAGNFAAGPTVVDLQESGSALPHMRLVVAPADIAESTSFRGGQVKGQRGGHGQKGRREKTA
jgi:hypothetical protein